jgi:hypothetical protein
MASQLVRATFGNGASAALAILAVIASSVLALTQPIDREAQPITPFLAEPIPSRLPSTDETKNWALADLLRSSEKPIVLLAIQSDHASLLVGASRTGFGTPFPLPTRAFRLQLAEGAGDTLWIGGVSGIAVSITSSRLSNGYLAKVDRLGHFFWEREFGERETARSIESLLALPSRDVVVSGQDSERTWLARISNEGNVVWERYVGLGKGSAVTTIDGIGWLAAIEAIGREVDYREDIAVWSFSEAGELLGHRTVREEINRVPGAHAADIRIEKANNAVYVFSAWAGIGDEPKPLEVAKLDGSGTIVWRKKLAQTVAPFRGRMVYSSSAIAVLSNGDPLISYPIDEPTNLVLTRLDAANGNATQMGARLADLPMPRCANRWALVRFLKEKSPKSIWLFGSPWQGMGADACGWIGEASVPDK